VVGELWQHGRASLPPAAVPQTYVAVESFPMTGNNKVDYPELTRQALAHQGLGQQPAGTAPASPAAPRHGDELIDRLVKLWSGLLRREGLGADANFFASGGHSLLGAKLVQDIEGELGVKLKLTDLFDHPTPAALAARIRAATPDPS
jgi:acyl carrier protein